MADFKKYIHLEKYGTTEVEGIEFGRCYIFPKIDGTNASVWWDNGVVQAGSRKRHLSLEKDNAGFFGWVQNHKGLNRFFAIHGETFRLYGEWLVPHSLKTYRDDAWRQFYVFDVERIDTGEFLPYDEYVALLDGYEIEVINPLCIIKNPTYENLLTELENNKYLLKENQGAGEGIVLKNYAYKNKYGRVCWAKVVTQEFKEKHVKEMGAPEKNAKRMAEQEICDKYVTSHLIEKTYSKILLDNDGWNSKMIPRLLHTVFYDLIREEMWDIVKTMKNPLVNFKTLSTLTTLKIKETKPELF